MNQISNLKHNRVVNHYLRKYGKHWKRSIGPIHKCTKPRTTDTQWRHKSKISENLGQCGRQNMLPPYLKIWDWDWIFGRAVKDISSLGVRSPCKKLNKAFFISFREVREVSLEASPSQSSNSSICFEKIPVSVCMPPLPPLGTGMGLI